MFLIKKRVRSEISLEKTFAVLRFLAPFAKVFSVKFFKMPDPQKFFLAKYSRKKSEFYLLSSLTQVKVVSNAPFTFCDAAKLMN